MKVGVYAGSFNPFHKGHLNILMKATRIFDKVIIARGVNPEKTAELVPLPNYLSDIPNVILGTYDGLLTDYMMSLGEHYESVTLVRGLRNSVDLQYEMNQYRFLQDLMPDIKMVSLFCDKEYEHISSSAIRLLAKYNKHSQYLI